MITTDEVVSTTDEYEKRAAMGRFTAFLYRLLGYAIRLGINDCQLAFLGASAYLVRYVWRSPRRSANYFAALVLWTLSLEPIREVRIHNEGFAAASRLSMIRIMARRTNAVTVAA